MGPEEAKWLEVASAREEMNRTRAAAYAAAAAQIQNGAHRSAAFSYREPYRGRTSA